MDYGEESCNWILDTGMLKSSLILCLLMYLLRIWILDYGIRIVELVFKFARGLLRIWILNLKSSCVIACFCEMALNRNPAPCVEDLVSTLKCPIAICE